MIERPTNNRYKNFLPVINLLTSSNSIYRCSQFKIIMALHTLFSDCLCNSFGVSTLKLTRQKITKPAFKQRSNTTHEEQPHTPARCPDTTAWTLAHWTLSQTKQKYVEKNISRHQSHIIVLTFQLWTESIQKRHKNKYIYISKVGGHEIKAMHISIKYKRLK